MSDTEKLAALAEKLAAAIEQMHLAHKMRDEKRFNAAHKEAAELAFELEQALEEEGEG